MSKNKQAKLGNINKLQRDIKLSIQEEERLINQFQQERERIKNTWMLE